MALPDHQTFRVMHAETRFKDAEGNHDPEPVRTVDCVFHAENIADEIRYCSVHGGSEPGPPAPFDASATTRLLDAVKTRYGGEGWPTHLRFSVAALVDAARLSASVLGAFEGGNPSHEPMTLTVDYVAFVALRAAFRRLESAQEAGR